MQDRGFNRIYFAVCGLVFLLVALRAFFIPINHDEASTFFFYVQSNNFMPYKAHVYTNNHVLNSALANICYHLAGSHRFVLRIPNLLAFLVLCFGVLKFFRYLNKRSSKIILATFFILTFNFLDFFEMCRGYGLSMAFLVLGLAWLQDYFSSKKLRPLVLASLYLQLALAANLTLVVILTVLLTLVFLFQFRHRLFMDLRNLLLQAVNLVLLIFWIKFSFFYKSKGVLDSGMGDDYWQVSFKSLMLFIYGTDYLWIQLLILTLFSVMLIYSVYTFFRRFSFEKIFVPQYFYVILLTVFIVVFYLQKKLMDVNYPEDRTGLFFYVFFALSLVFFLESLPALITGLFAGSFAVASGVFFTLSFDLKSFTNYFYHVIPKEVYSYLEQEFMKDQKIFTVGGHVNREMNYAFANYRGGAMLNVMDDSRQMHMNCDYYFALKAEEPYYRFFYDEVVQDERWGRVLLKRRQRIVRHELPGLRAGGAKFSGNGEFYELLRFKDSLLPTRNCLEAEIELTFNKTPKPFKASLVFQLNNKDNNTIYYKRVPLNWISDDLSGQTRRFKLTTGAIPGDFKDAVVYIWNIDKKELDVRLNDLKILELRAPGINVSIPENYYPFISQFNPQPHL